MWNIKLKCLYNKIDENIIEINETLQELKEYKYINKYFIYIKNKYLYINIKKIECSIEDCKIICYGLKELMNKLLKVEIKIIFCELI